MKILALSHLKFRFAGVGLIGLILLLVLGACGESTSSSSLPAAAATATPALTPTAAPTTPDTRPRVTTAAPIAPATISPTTAVLVPKGQPSIATSPIPSNASRAAQEDDIREMIFRYTFQHSFGGNVPKLYFLSLASTLHISTERKDPGDELLKRFQGESFTVKKILEADISRTSPFGVTDKMTGEKGLVYGVSDIKWISDTEVEIEGSHYMFGMTAGGTTYRVGRENGKWVIKETRMVWTT